MNEQYEIGKNYLRNKMYRQAGLIFYKLYGATEWQQNINEYFLLQLLKSISLGANKKSSFVYVNQNWEEIFANTAFEIANAIGIDAKRKFPNSDRLKNQFYWNIYLSPAEYNFNDVINNLSPNDINSPFDSFVLRECREGLHFHLNNYNEQRRDYYSRDYDDFKEKINRQLTLADEENNNAIDFVRLISLLEIINSDNSKHELVIKQYINILPRLYYSFDRLDDCLNTLLKFPDYLSVMDKVLIAKLFLKRYDGLFSNLLTDFAQKLNIHNANSLKRYIISYVGIVENENTGLTVYEIVNLMVGEYNWNTIAQIINNNNPDFLNEAECIRDNITRILRNHEALGKNAILGNCLIMLHTEINLQPILNDALPVHITATDLSQYLFCPVSYSLNKTFQVSTNEFQETGIKLHEKSLINSLRRVYTHQAYFGQQEGVTINADTAVLNQFLADIRGEEIFAGHRHENPAPFINHEGDIKGIPDFIYKNTAGQVVVVEEKYTSHQTEISRPYANHLMQLLCYIYAFDNIPASYGYLIYWEINRYQRQLARISIFKVEKNAENEQYYFNNLAKFNEFRLSGINEVTNKINLKKCVKCSVNTYCKHKYGEIGIVQLPYTRTE